MTYGNEAVLFPVADLYDQGAMQMYIEAAKDQYNRGQKAIDDFVAKYGDFTSPIAADVEYWDNNTMAPIIDMYDEYVRNGIDPVRNPEARNALMARARRLPYAKLAAIRQNAEDAREYRKAQQKLIQEGKYDNRFAKYDNVDLSTFRTIGDDGNINTIGQLSPTPMLPIGQFANPFFGDIKPRITKTTSGGVTTESEVLSAQDIQRYTEYVLPQILATPQGSMMYRRAVGEYKNNGYDDDTADSMALEDLRDNIAASQSWRIKNNTEYNDYSNQYKIDDHRTRNDNWLDQQKSARDFHYDLMKSGVDTDGNLVIDQEERRDYAKRVQTAKESKGKSGSETVVYAYNPAVRHVKNKDQDIYVIPAAEANNAELYAADGTKQKVNYNDEARGQDLNFIASGPVVPGNAYSLVYNKSNGVKERRYESGYFVYGTIAYKDPNTKDDNGKPKTKYITDKNGNPRVYKMRVTYGQKNEKK